MEVIMGESKKKKKKERDGMVDASPRVQCHLMRSAHGNQAGIRQAVRALAHTHTLTASVGRRGKAGTLPSPWPAGPSSEPAPA